MTGLEDLPCPCCGGDLYVHGTCKRNLKVTGGKVTLRLRVMECSKCETTHREMPNGLVPYKRYSAEMLCAIFNGHLPENDKDAKSVDALTSPKWDEYADDVCMCDISIRQRIIEWLLWFLARGQDMEETYSSLISADSICSRLKYYVRIIVNSGRWEQHRFVVPSS